MASITSAQSDSTVWSNHSSESLIVLEPNVTNVITISLERHPCMNISFPFGNTTFCSRSTIIVPFNQLSYLHTGRCSLLGNPFQQYSVMSYSFYSFGATTALVRCGSEIKVMDCGSNGEWNASGVADVCTITNPTITGTSLTFQNSFSIYYFLSRNRDYINGAGKLAYKLTTY